MSSNKKRRELNRSAEEYNLAKVCSQLAAGNHSMLNMVESVLGQEVEKLRAENESLKQQVEQGKRDAERYRQMKLLHDDPDGVIGVCEYEEGRDEWLFVTQDLSKYIDAAIAAPK